MAGLQIVSTGLLFGTGLRTTTGLTSGGGLQVAGLSGAAQLLLNETQGLAVDFTDLSMVIKDTTTPANNFDGDPNSKLTYSSPSTKWVLGANGLFSSGTTLRTSYDASGNVLGVRIEEARTNLLLQSQTFTNASWTKVSSTITASAATSPDGSANASKIVEDAITNVHNAQQAITKAASAIQYTFSGFVKAGERTWCELFVFDGAADGQRQYVNLTTGAAGNASAQGAGFTGVSFASSLRPDGWVYFAWVFTTNTATALQCRIYTASANGTDNYAGDGASGIYVWNMQLEAGAFATSPIVTTTGTVTRTADNITMATSLFPLSQIEGTIFAKWQINTTVPSFSPVVELTAASRNNSDQVLRHNAGTTIVGVVTGAAFAILINQTLTGSASANTVYKGAIRAKTNDFNSALNGVAQTAVTTGTWPGAALTTFSIGQQQGGGSYLNGYLAKLMYVPRNFTDPQMVAQTT